MNRKGNVYVTRLLPHPVMEKLKEVCDFEANVEPRPATQEELTIRKCFSIILKRRPT